MRDACQPVVAHLLLPDGERPKPLQALTRLIETAFPGAFTDLQKPPAVAGAPDERPDQAEDDESHRYGIHGRAPLFLLRPGGPGASPAAWPFGRVLPESRRGPCFRYDVQPRPVQRNHTKTAIKTATATA